jgi:CBS domain-containing protein
MITVSDAMTTRLHTCKKGETLDRAAKIMWEHGCSEVPVVDDDGFLITMVSDRSVGICAYTQGKALTQIPVTCGATERVEVVRTGDSLEFAHELMRKHHVRCLPVVEATGRLIGLLSITDVIGSTSLQGEPRLSANSVEAKGRSQR